MPGRNRARNPVAVSPLLRKGGVHIVSKTGQRVRYRLQTQSAIDEWLEEFEVANLAIRYNDKAKSILPKESDHNYFPVIGIIKGSSPKK